MCPACVASAAMVIGGLMSAGGLTMLVAKAHRAKNGVKKIFQKHNS